MIFFIPTSQILITTVRQTTVRPTTVRPTTITVTIYLVYKKIQSNKRTASKLTMFIINGKDLPLTAWEYLITEIDLGMDWFGLLSGSGLNSSLQ